MYSRCLSIPIDTPSRAAAGAGGDPIRAEEGETNGAQEEEARPGRTLGATKSFFFLTIDFSVRIHKDNTRRIQFVAKEH